MTVRQDNVISITLHLIAVFLTRFVSFQSTSYSVSSRDWVGPVSNLNLNINLPAILLCHRFWNFHKCVWVSQLLEEILFDGCSKSILKLCFCLLCSINASFFSNSFLLINTKKYHVFAPMGRFQLESIYLYFPPSSQLVYLCFCPVGLSLL